METEHTTHDTTLRTRGIPMTVEVLRRLEAEANRLVGHLPRFKRQRRRTVSSVIERHPPYWPRAICSSPVAAWKPCL